MRVGALSTLALALAVLVAPAAGAQGDLELRLLPTDANATSWDLVLDCPNDVGLTSIVTGFVLPLLTDANDVDFGGCGGPGDSDADGVVDGADNCPFVPNPDQTASAQYPTVGCACLCGDPNRDCAVNVGDAPEAQRAGLVPPLPPLSPSFDIAFCDFSGDGVCNVADSSEMQRAGLFPPQPPLNPGAGPTVCAGYTGGGLPTARSCATSTELAATIDPTASFTLGPGFHDPNSAFPPPGIRDETLYVKLQAFPASTICAPGASLLLANLVAPLPGPVHTRQGVGLLPAQFSPPGFQDANGPVADERIVFFRAGVDSFFAVGIRRAHDALAGDPNFPADPNNPAPPLSRWELTLKSDDTEFHHFSVGLILPQDAGPNDAVFGGCTTPGPGLHNERLCTADPDLGPAVDALVSKTVGPSPSLAGIARSDTIYISVTGLRPTDALAGLNAPGQKIRLGVVELSGSLVAPDFPIITFEGQDAVVPPPSTISGVVPSLPPGAGAPDGDTRQEDNEEGDQDQDTMGDDVDNCIFTPNDPNWSDVGGVAPRQDEFDSIGDVCQCGDLDGDGRVVPLEFAALRDAFAESIPLSPEAGLLCNVRGPTDPTPQNGIPADCDMVDVVVMHRATSGQTTQLDPVCDPAATPP